MQFKPNPELKVIDQVREVLRYHHYAYRTEQSYCLDSALYPFLWHSYPSQKIIEDHRVIKVNLKSGFHLSAIKDVLV